MNIKHRGPKALLIAIAAFIIILVAGIAGMGQFRKYDPGDIQTSTTYAPSAADGEVNADRGFLLEMLQYNLEPGAAYEYGFRTGISVKFPGRDTIDLKNAGYLTVHVLRTSPMYLHLILDIAIAAESAVLPVGKSTPEGAYRLYAKVDRFGRIFTLRSNPALDDKATQYLRDLMAIYWQALPAAGSRPSESGESLWSSLFGTRPLPAYIVAGEDTQGGYEARLSIRAPHTGGKLQLHMLEEKTRYTHSQLPITIKESERNIDWDLSRGAPIRITGAESVMMGAQTESDGGSIEAERDYLFDLRNVGRSAVTADDLAGLTRELRIYETISVAGAQPERRNATQKQTATWPEVAALLDDAGKMEAEDQARAFQKLALTVRSNPQLIQHLAGHVHNFEPHDDRFQMIVGALGYSGANPAQAALVQIYENGGSDRIAQQSVLSTLSLMEQPASRETVDFLSDVFHTAADENLRNSAGLSLGAALSRAPSGRIYELLERRWREARNQVERDRALQMIGNSGDDRFFPVLARIIRAKDKYLMRSALYALRFMHSDRASELLLETIRGDSEAGTKAVAVSALASHPWRDSYFEALAACVRTERQVDLRIECADGVAGNNPRSAAMDSILSEIVRKGAGSSELKDYIEFRRRQ